MRVRLRAGGMVRLLMLCGLIAEMALTPLAQVAPPAAYAQNPATSRPPLPPAVAVATTPATAAAPSATMTTTAAALSASATLVATPMSSAAATTTTTTTATATVGVSATVAPAATATVTPGSALSATVPPTATIDANATVTPSVSSLVTATVPLTATGTATATATVPLTATGTDTALTGTVATLNSAADVTPTADALARLPLAFESNQGQTDASVQFLSHGPGFSLYLTGTGATLGVVSRPHAPRRQALGHARDQGLGRGLTRADAITGTAPISATSVRLRYDGADPHARVSGDDQLPGVATYLVGADPSRWQVDVPTYARVPYHDVYPGMDLVYYGTVGRLEYDWRLAAEADPGRITLAVDGARRVSLDAAGNLVLGAALGPIVQQAPAAYQEDGGQRVPVDVRYTLTGTNRAGFAVGAYDTRKPLVIDPVLTYSTYLGGGGTDYGNGIAVDGAGAAYVVGETGSTTFPTTPGAPQRSLRGAACGVPLCANAYATKLTPSGGALVYSTYLGGSGGAGHSAAAVAVDNAGDAYLVGTTSSPDFLTADAVQSRYGGGTTDAFVTELNAAGTAPVYSTYLGGGNDDFGDSIAVDAAGGAYITGYTYGSFPTANALQASSGGGSQDAFVAKIRGTRSGSVPWHAHGGGGMGSIGGGVDLQVDLADGHLDARMAGLSLSGRGPDIAIERTWDSTLAGAGGGGLAASVTPRMGGVLTATVSYTDGSGAVWPFVYTGGPTAAPPYTAYAPPAGQPWQLTAATNGYTLTNFLTSEFWAFDSQGRLTGDTDAYGNKVGYSYGASSATSPNSVVNSGGRAALLGYTNGQLTDVQSPLWASSGGAQG